MAQAVQFAILGLGAGAAYTLLAQGIVLIYRGSGIVNFAHGAIAMFARVLLLPHARRRPRLAGRGRDPGGGAARRAPRGRHPEWHPPLHAGGRAIGPSRRDARGADRAPGARRAEALGQRLPPDRPVPAHPQLHVARMVRLQRCDGARRRPGGPPHPGRHRDRAHVRAVGLHPVHAYRARDLRECGERAGGRRRWDGRRTSSPPSRGRSAAPPPGSPASCSPRTRG